MPQLLIDKFQDIIQENVRSLKEKVQKQQRIEDDSLPIMTSTWETMLRELRKGEKVYFIESTMNMLYEKASHYQQTLQEVLEFGEQYAIQSMADAIQRVNTMYWLEYCKPITVNTNDGTPYLSVSAMLFWMPGKHLVSGKDMLQLMLIEPSGEISKYMLWLRPDGEWIYDPGYHACRQCERLGDAIIPCVVCNHIATAFHRIFSISNIIAGQYLAQRKYEEVTRTGTIRKPREKNEKKERSITTKHIFKTIDANEIIIKVPPVDPDSVPDPHEKHGSWMEGAEVEYTEIRTRPFSRIYRHPRYINMQGRTQAFPEGIQRMQPRKKENAEKHITKVKASDYE